MTVRIYRGFVVRKRKSYDGKFNFLEDPNNE